LPAFHWSPEQRPILPSALSKKQDVFIKNRNRSDLVFIPENIQFFAITARSDASSRSPTLHTFPVRAALHSLRHRRRQLRYPVAPATH
jgi:hypothetical protein